MKYIFIQMVLAANVSYAIYMERWYVAAFLFSATLFFLLNLIILMIIDD